MTSKSSGCVRQTTSKYSSRPSPSYPANKCCSRTMTGNDGNRWTSKRASNGICRWIKNN